MSHITDPSDPPLPVGRERELAILRQHLDAALKGHGSLVLISGEAGIGKTALAEAVCREAIARGAAVLTGHCYDLIETPPYGPWIELFARYPAPETPPPRPIPFTDGNGPDTAHSQAAFLQTVHVFLAATAASCPHVLVLDDLHWADTASLELLRHLTHALATMPLLIVAMYRADELTPNNPLYAFLPHFIREAQPMRLAIRPIGDADVDAWMQERYALPETETARLVSFLQARAEGNPFYLSELLWTLEERAVLHSTEDGWTLGDPAPVGVPPLLRQVIDGRLRRLGEEACGLLGVAAVIGHEVSLPLLREVGGVEDETLRDIMERAGAARVLEEVPDGAYARFVHALIRATLYEGLSSVQRRTWHQRAGEAFLGSSDPDPDAVAYHFHRAGDQRAAEWLYRAGIRAWRARAWATVVERMDAALAVLDQRVALGPNGGPFGTAQENEAFAAHIRFWRGSARDALGNIHDGLLEMQAAYATLDALSSDDCPRLHALLEATHTVADQRGYLMAMLAPIGYHDKVLTLAERLTPIPDPFAHADPFATYQRGLAERGLAITLASIGKPDVARDAMRRARALFIASTEGAKADRGIYGAAGSAAIFELWWVTLPYFTDDVAGRCQLVAESETMLRRAPTPGDFPVRWPHLPLLYFEGSWDEARSLAQAIHDLNIVGFQLQLANNILGPLAYARGDTASLGLLIHDRLPDGANTERGARVFWTATMCMRLATAVAIDEGDLAVARGWLEAYDLWFSWSGAVLGLAEGQLSWAAYERAAGNQSKGYEHARQALAHATEPRQPLALIAAYRLLGELDTAVGRYEVARTHLDASLALANSCAIPYERALTLLAQVELHAAEHRRDDASALLDEIRTILTPLGAKPALARADALIAQRAAQQPALPAYPDSLTTREVDVLRLIAAGKSNMEIAAALFISSRTVNRHIENLYRKIGAHGRADATAYALRHHLT